MVENLDEYLIFLKDTPTPGIYTLSLHDALPIQRQIAHSCHAHELGHSVYFRRTRAARSEEHTSELQSLRHLVCRLLLEKKKTPDRRTSRPRLLRLTQIHTLYILDLRNSRTKCST